MLYFEIVGHLLNRALIKNRKMIQGTIWAHFKIIVLNKTTKYFNLAQNNLYLSKNIKKLEN